MKHIFSFPALITGIVVVVAVVLLNQFMYLLPIHVGAFVVTIVAVIIADLQALLWVIGKLPTLKRRPINVLHYIVSAGLFASVTSGAFLFWPLREYLVTVETFWVKMVFVAVLIINSFVIARHMHVPTTQTFASLSPAQRRPLLLSGAASAISWVTVFVAALLLPV
jgi:hypothetical protein